MGQGLAPQSRDRYPAGNDYREDFFFISNGAVNEAMVSPSEKISYQLNQEGPRKSEPDRKLHFGVIF